MIENHCVDHRVGYGPRVQDDPRRRINITLRASVHALMASMAQERGCSRSHLLETLLLDAERLPMDSARSSG